LNKEASTMPPKPERAFDDRRTRKAKDDPQPERSKRDEPASPETNGSATAIEIEDLNAANDI
jgi:hypothetical protein